MTGFTKDESARTHVLTGVSNCKMQTENFKFSLFNLQFARFCPTVRDDAENWGQFIEVEAFKDMGLRHIVANEPSRCQGSIDRA